MHKINLFFLILLTGCVSAKPLTLPDGSQGHRIRCDGSALSWGSCAAKAGELCVNGYDIVFSNNENNFTSTLSGTEYGLFANANNVNYREMFVKCVSPSE